MIDDEPGHRATSVKILRVAGLHLGGSGYPNARGTLALLRDRLGLDIREEGRWLPDDFRLWRIGNAGLPARLFVMARLFAGNAASLMRTLVRNAAQPAPVYVPYPAVFLLWMLSWVPRRWRPVTIADAYVSLWDSMVMDRSRARPDGLLSRLLRRFESRALRTADRVLVDTAANERFYVEQLAIAPERLRSLPLAIDLSAAVAGPPDDRPSEAPLRVLFIGTFIPLHGILGALRQLAPLLADRRFEFQLIGDGQDADQVQAFLATVPDARVRWMRDWQSAETLADAVRAADVCLGVFGGRGKAARVLPFKVYLYLALGKPVLTQRECSVPAGAPLPPVVAVDLADAGGLEQALLRLQRDPGLRARLGEQGAEYFEKHLGSTCLAGHWRDLLAGLPACGDVTSRR